MPAVVLLIALVLQAGAAPGAYISGRVTDKASGQPIPRVVVALVPTNRTQARETLTDGEGRYQFLNVAPGTYAVGADNDDHHATYLRQWFGVAEPADAVALPPQPNVEITADHPRADIDIALTRALGIEGRVLDSIGEPLEGVSVTVLSSGGRPVSVPASRSDDLGAYRIYGLRPGRYRVCADIRPDSAAWWPDDRPVPSRTCYPSSAGDRGAADVNVSAQDAVNIEIQMLGTAGAPYDTRTNRADAIRGRVVDKESGKPVVHAAIRIAQRGDSGSLKDFSTMTDGDGLFRFSNLPPGRYNGFVDAPRHRSVTLYDASHNPDLTVRADATLNVPVALPRAYAINVRLVDEFDSPISDVRVTVRSENGGAGSVMSAFGILSDDRGHLRLPDLAPGRYFICAEPVDYSASSRFAPAKRDRFLRTCYPSAASDAEAQAVVVGSADIEDLELRMVRGRVLSISGTVLDSAGAPAHAIAALAKYAIGSSTSRGFDVDAQGRFRLVNVLPGEYAIEATLGNDAAFVPIRLDNDGIENLVITMQKTFTVHGRMTIDDQAPAPPPSRGGAPPMVRARLAADRLPGMGSTRIAVSDVDRTFTLEEVFGRRWVEVTDVPPGWFVKTIRYGTNDVGDGPVEFKDGDQSLEIVLSNRGASIAGTIADVRDHRMKDAQVLLFRAPANKDDAPRFVGGALSVTGDYSFGPLREGDYVIVAVPGDARPPVPGDWDRAARFAAYGERVTLAEMDQRTVELRVVSVR